MLHYLLNIYIAYNRLVLNLVVFHAQVIASRYQEADNSWLYSVHEMVPNLAPICCKLYKYIIQVLHYLLHIYIAFNRLVLNLVVFHAQITASRYQEADNS